MSVKPRRAARASALSTILVLAQLGMAGIAHAGPAPHIARRSGDGTGRDGLVLLGPTAPDTTVALSLVLRFPGTSALRDYLDAQQRSGRASALTPSEIGERFGLPAARVDDATRLLFRAGITVTERFQQRTALLARGSARAVEQLFHVRLEEFRTADGLRVRVPSATARIPSDLADVIARVDGLDTRPAFQLQPMGGGDPQPVPIPGPSPSSRSTPEVLAPQQMAKVYDGTPLTSAGIDGSGETVAVLSLATLHGEETKAWARHFNTRATPDEEIPVEPHAPTPIEPGWDKLAAIEVALDLEMVRALAPDATILDYSTQPDFGGWMRVVNQVVQDHRASMLTMSYGACETAWDRVDLGDEMRNSEATFLAARAAGVDVFSASGDVGPYGCNDQNGDTSDRQVVVDYPASSASVIGVGGTTLHANGNRFSEDAWQEPVSVVGSGGGASRDVARPAAQRDDVVHDDGTARLVPDVAGPASELLNLEIGVWAKNQVVGTIASGTSAAAPFFAGAMALVKQYVRGRLGQFPDGNLLTLLYVIGSRPDEYSAAFNDITTGSNEQFSAGPGWDSITGLGSPNIAGLARTLETLIQNG